LSQVRGLLGHASIVTTERYETMTLRSLQVAAAKLERGRAFDSSHERQMPTASNEAPAEFCQESVKSRGEAGQSHTRSQSPALEPNELNDLNLLNWLGVRDDFRNWLIRAA
jgi:hypothetical protein